MYHLDWAYRQPRRTVKNSEEVKCASGQKCREIRKVSHGLVIRKGFIEEAGAVLDLKDSRVLDGQREKEGI